MAPDFLRWQETAFESAKSQQKAEDLERKSDTAFDMDEKFDEKEKLKEQLLAAKGRRG